MKRIFLAITLPETLQREIQRWQDGHGDLPVRWIAGKNLHITMVPPWEEAEVERVIHSVREAANGAGPFSVRFSRVTYGPDIKKPRLIWATGHTPMEMDLLAKKLRSVLPGNGEARGLRSHITVARFRPGDFKKINHPMEEAIDWRMEVRSIVLMESQLSSDGANYEIVKEFEL